LYIAWFYVQINFFIILINGGNHVNVCIPLTTCLYKSLEMRFPHVLCCHLSRMLDTSAPGQIGTRTIRHLCFFSLILRINLPIALNQFQIWLWFWCYTYTWYCNKNLKWNYINLLPSWLAFNTTTSDCTECKQVIRHRKRSNPMRWLWEMATSNITLNIETHETHCVEIFAITNNMV
jgi:hypothetical protein